MPSDATIEHPEIKNFWGPFPQPPRIASIHHLLPIMEILYSQTVIFISNICEILAQITLRYHRISTKCISTKLVI